MRIRQALDLSIVLCEITGIILVGKLSGDDLKKFIIIIFMAGIAIFFAILFGKDSLRYRWNDSEWVANGKITQIVLLSEENTEIASWDIYGKTSIVFGRDEGERKAPGLTIDIDLSNTAFAASIDRQHAIMNYCNDGWYLEDLDSENGVRVKPAKEAGKCKISPGMPCRIGRGDLIFLGLTSLKVR